MRESQGGRIRGMPHRIDPPINNRCIRHGQVTQRVRAATVSNFAISPLCPLHKCVQTVHTAGPPNTRLEVGPPGAPQLFGHFDAGDDRGREVAQVKPENLRELDPSTSASTSVKQVSHCKWLVESNSTSHRTRSFVCIYNGARKLLKPHALTRSCTVAPQVAISAFMAIGATWRCTVGGTARLPRGAQRRARSLSTRSRRDALGTVR